MNETISNEYLGQLFDTIRIEGIYSEGFGIVPTVVMLDPDLPLLAKAIYVYFCSFCGGGEGRQVPNTKIIQKQLNISQGSYYKYYNTLVEQGYVVAEQVRGTGKFQQTEYCLPILPEKYQNSSDSSAVSKVYELVRERGIFALGYGSMPRTVAKNGGVDATAKVIYALLSICDNNDSPFPCREDIPVYLGLSKSTYNKHFDQLVEYQYIQVKNE